MEFKTTQGLFESVDDPMYVTLMEERSNLLRQLQDAEQAPAEQYRRMAELSDHVFDNLKTRHFAEKRS